MHSMCVILPLLVYSLLSFLSVMVCVCGNLKVSAGGVEVVAMREMLSRIMVQTARQTGLALVYRDLLSYEV